MGRVGPGKRRVAGRSLRAITHWGRPYTTPRVKITQPAAKCGELAIAHLTPEQTFSLHGRVASGEEPLPTSHVGRQCPRTGRLPTNAVGLIPGAGEADLPIHVLRR